MPKQENAAENTAAVTNDILKMFNMAKMPLLADVGLYIGIPAPILSGLHKALALQLSEDGDRRFKNRMRYAGILKERTDNTFRWDDNTYPMAETGVIEKALSIDFVRHGKNFIMAGPPGTGKTLLAVIVACKAIRAGFSVKYKSAHDIATELQEAREGFGLAGYIKRMQSYDMLVIEDITFSTPDAKVAQDFFSIVDKRYGRKTTVVTTNGNVKEWIDSFPDKRMCSAFIGRLYEEALLLNMNGAIDMRLAKARGMLGSAYKEPDVGGGAVDYV